MKKHVVKYFLLVICLGLFTIAADAQKKGGTKPKPKGRVATKRPSTSKTAKGKTKASIKPTAPVTDTVAKVAPVQAPLKDSLPIKKVLPSLRPDEAVETSTLKDR